MTEAAQSAEEQKRIRSALVAGDTPACPRCEVALTTRPIGGGSFGLGYARRGVADLSALPAKCHIRREARERETDHVNRVGHCHASIAARRSRRRARVLACAGPKTKASRSHRADRPTIRRRRPSRPSPPRHRSRMSRGLRPLVRRHRARRAVLLGAQRSGAARRQQHATSARCPVQVGEGIKWRAVTVGGSHSCAITDGWCGVLLGVERCGPTRKRHARIAARLPRDCSKVPPFVHRSPPVRTHTAPSPPTGSSTAGARTSTASSDRAASASRAWRPRSRAQLTWAFVSAGPHDSCAITTDGSSIAGDSTTVARSASSRRRVRDRWRARTVRAAAAPAGRTRCDSRRSPRARTTVARSRPRSVLYCWGSNDHGQLGSGFREPLAPTPVMGDANATRRCPPVASFTCALTTAGEARCWGADDEGQLAGALRTQRCPRRWRAGYDSLALLCHVAQLRTRGRSHRVLLGIERQRTAGHRRAQAQLRAGPAEVRELTHLLPARAGSAL